MKAPLPFLILCALVPLSLAQGARLEGVVRDGQGSPEAMSPWCCGTANGCGRIIPSRPARAPTKGQYRFTGPWRSGEGRLLAYHAGKSLAAYGEAPAGAKPWNCPPEPSRPISCEALGPVAGALPAPGRAARRGRRNQPGPRRALDPFRGIGGRACRLGGRHGGGEILQRAIRRRRLLHLPGGGGEQGHHGAPAQAGLD